MEWQELAGYPGVRVRSDLTAAERVAVQRTLAGTVNKAIVQKPYGGRASGARRPVRRGFDGHGSGTAHADAIDHVHSHQPVGDGPPIGHSHLHDHGADGTAGSHAHDSPEHLAGHDATDWQQLFNAERTQDASVRSLTATGYGLRAHLQATVLRALAAGAPCHFCGAAASGMDRSNFPVCAAHQ